MTAEQYQASTAGSDSRVDAGLTLATLLNVLWRWKLLILVLTGLGLIAGFTYGLVVTPLYRATAQVRPGITSYTDTGAPVREWRLKDITRFFQRRFYLESMREQMGWAPGEGHPIIQADFIARGSQNIQGGNVITLQTLSPTPEEAQAILEAAVLAFNQFAAADTVSNGLFLTRHGLEIQIENLRTELLKLDTEESRLDLEIEKQEAELELIEAELQRIDIELRKIEEDNQFRQLTLERNEQEARTILTHLVAIEELLETLEWSEPTLVQRRDSLLNQLGSNQTNPWLLANLLRNDAEAINSIILGNLAGRSEAFANQTRADSLRHEIKLAAYFVEDLRIQKNIELEKLRNDIRTEIADLTLQRDSDLAHQRTDIRQEIRGKQTQLRALVSLERVGHITTSQTAVRPRKLRAISILTLLALAGSVCLALICEYLVVNRDQILRGDGTGG
ncbi:MAG: Wzz/FepE/Etk N-terminal domain-containing protein [bacterium]